MSTTAEQMVEEQDEELAELERAFVKEIQTMAPTRVRRALQRLVERAAVQGAEIFMQWMQDPDGWTIVDVQPSAKKMIRQRIYLAFSIYNGTPDTRPLIPNILPDEYYRFGPADD